jgi:hypothetical protein
MTNRREGMMKEKRGNDEREENNNKINSNVQLKDFCFKKLAFPFGWEGKLQISN